MQFNQPYLWRIEITMIVCFLCIEVYFSIGCRQYAQRSHVWNWKLQYIAELEGRAQALKVCLLHEWISFLL